MGNRLASKYVGEVFAFLLKNTHRPTSFIIIQHFQTIVVPVTGLHSLRQKLWQQLTLFYTFIYTHSFIELLLKSHLHMYQNKAKIAEVIITAWTLLGTTWFEHDGDECLVSCGQNGLLFLLVKSTGPETYPSLTLLIWKENLHSNKFQNVQNQFLVSTFIISHGHHSQMAL